MRQLSFFYQLEKNFIRTIFLAVVCVMLFTRFVFGADGIDVTPVDFQQWLLQVLNWVLSIKGASVLVAVVGVTQLLMQFFKTNYGTAFVGKYQLLVLAFLTVASLVAGGLSTGLSFLQAVMQGPVVAALQVFVYQIIKQFQQT